MTLTFQKKKNSGHAHPSFDMTPTQDIRDLFAWRRPDTDHIIASKVSNTVLDLLFSSMPVSCVSPIWLNLHFIVLSQDRLTLLQSQKILTLLI